MSHLEGGHETTRGVVYGCDQKGKGYFSSKDPMDGSFDAETEPGRFRQISSQRVSQLPTRVIS